MGAIADALGKLREKGCIIQRGDGKWMGDWDEKPIDSSAMRVMQAFGYIELVDRRRCDSTSYPAYVITDKGRTALEEHEASNGTERLVK